MYEDMTRKELIQLIYRQTVSISRLEARVKELEQNATLLVEVDNNKWSWKLVLNPLNWFKKKNKSDNNE